MIATSNPTGMPTDPALRSRGGSGLHAMGEAATSAIPYHSITGASKARSSSAKTRGGSGADEERTKRNRQSAVRSRCAGLGQNCLMHGGHRGVPRRLKSG